MKRITHLTSIFLFIFFFNNSACGKNILEYGASDFFTIQKTQEGNEISVDISDLNGNKLSSEKIFLENEQFKKYTWQQFQTGESVNLELKGNELHFKSPDKNKVIKFSDEEFKKIFLPPLLTNSLLERIKKEPRVKKFEVIAIVPDKMMTLDFNFEKKSENKNEVVWRLEPDSFFVGLIVRPITIIFDQNQKLLKIKDITLPIRPTQKTSIIFK